MTSLESTSSPDLLSEEIDQDDMRRSHRMLTFHSLIHVINLVWTAAAALYLLRD